MKNLRNKRTGGSYGFEYEVHFQLPEKRYILKAWLLVQAVGLWEMFGSRMLSSVDGDFYRFRA